MKTLLTLRDSDFGIDTPFPEEHTKRSAARAVVFDAEGRVALLHATVIGYHSLPGGGIEENEDIEKALAREMLEEIGCAIANIRELGIVEEFRSEQGLHHVSYYFLADIDGEKGEPQMTEQEIAEGYEPVWIDLNEAIAILEEESTSKKYAGKFMAGRNLAALKAARILI